MQLNLQEVAWEARFHEVILISAGRKSGGFTLSPLFFFFFFEAKNWEVINHGANWDLPACRRMSRLLSFRPKQVAQLFVSRREHNKLWLGPDWIDAGISIGQNRSFPSWELRVFASLCLRKKLESVDEGMRLEFLNKRDANLLEWLFKVFL